MRDSYSSSQLVRLDWTNEHFLRIIVKLVLGKTEANAVWFYLSGGEADCNHSVLWKFTERLLKYAQPAGHPVYKTSFRR
jgi:hypothetical protein